MKKNCENCKHLQWEDCDEGPGSGFTCNKRYDQLYEVSEKQADQLIKNLESDNYLKKSKVCCDLKDPGEMIVDLECPKCSDIFKGYARDEGSLCLDCYTDEAS
jgi:hypothetical protein